MSKNTVCWAVVFPMQQTITLSHIGVAYVIEHTDQEEAVLEAAHRLIQDTVTDAGPPEAHSLLASYLAAGAVSAEIRP